MGEQLSRPGQPKIGSHIIYDLDYLTEADVPIEGPFYDIQNAEPLLDETQLTYGLEHIAQRRLGEGKRHEQMTQWLTRAYGADHVKDNIWRAPSPIAGPYAESDVDLPLRIFAEQERELRSQGLWELFELESKLIPMLLGMRRRGVRVDLDRAQELRGVMAGRRDRAIAEVKRITGIAPDIWAAESLANVFREAGIWFPLTLKNKPSFRKDWLEQQDSPIGKLIAEARRMDKFCSTFVDSYILNGHYNGRVHCQFHQLRSDNGGAVSGRFASSMPNLQNIPIRDEEVGKLIRDIFIPEEDCRWFKLDWSQIEFRLAVHFAASMKVRGELLPGVEDVVSRYHNDPNTDYHRFTAELTGLDRKYAKSINFGIVYGLGVEGLCGQLGIEKEEGLNILSQYHRELPFVKPLYNKALQRAEQQGEIITLLKRKRRFNTFQKYGSNQYFREDEFFENVPQDERRGWKRAFGHKALNALLQGSAADIMKMAMVQISEDSTLIKTLGYPHLTVHDELDGSLPHTKEAEDALKEVRHIMETCVQLKVPLVSDLAIAETWGKT